jgi:hypothetical protein
MSNTSIVKAVFPVRFDIEIGIKQYYNEQSRRAIHTALIGFYKGRIAIIKLPNPINSNITESTMPIICY